MYFIKKLKIANKNTSATFSAFKVFKFQNRADRAGNEALRERLEQEERRENEQLRERLEREFESAKSEAESNAQGLEVKNLRQDIKQSPEPQQNVHLKQEVQQEAIQLPDAQLAKKLQEGSEHNENKQNSDVKQFPVQEANPLRNSDLRNSDLNDYVSA